ncbi:2-amino-4-hydroxy-6-hydroxymethyldihydropteridine diphosphokinase, partial [Pseudomonas brassicacearum]
ALGQLPQTTLVGVSAFYQSDSLLPGQPRYTNAVAALDSDLAPIELLDALQAIENDQGRERLERWGPRTLDLDILLFGDRLIDEPRLKVPHYQIQER